MSQQNAQNEDPLNLFNDKPPVEIEDGATDDPLNILDDGNEKISREDELILEGIINDYFYRRKIKDKALFGDLDAYGNVLSNNIAIYVYPKDGTISTANFNVIGDRCQFSTKSQSQVRSYRA